VTLFHRETSLILSGQLTIFNGGSLNFANSGMIPVTVGNRSFDIELAAIGRPTPGGFPLRFVGLKMERVALYVMTDSDADRF
jgi:hypothetical protein